MTAALLTLAMDNSLFSYNSYMYRCRKWENEGKIYQKIFKVRSWKKYLPDGGALMKGGYVKRPLQTLSKEGLQRFLVESWPCRIIPHPGDSAVLGVRFIRAARSHSLYVYLFHGREPSLHNHAEIQPAAYRPPASGRGTF